MKMWDKRGAVELVLDVRFRFTGLGLRSEFDPWTRITYYRTVSILHFAIND